MKYYHGTGVYFKHFVMPIQKNYKDFGNGIYLATREEQARDIALRKGGIHAYVYTYQVNLSDIRRQFNVKEFNGASTEWVKFIIENRTRWVQTDYDLIIGPTADARIQYVIQMVIDYSSCYRLTDADYQRIKQMLKPEVYGTQICIKSQRLLNVFNNSRIKETMIR